jgi:putative ABC transport system substrate-binding protein
MNRRRSIAAMAALAAAGIPLLRVAAAEEIPRVGILMYGSRANSESRVEAFKAAMRNLGYAEGRTVVYDSRVGNGQDDLIRSHARALAMGGTDVILSGSPNATHAFKSITTTVPVVIAGTEDPVLEGFVHSLEKPGGNITGIASGNVDHLDRHLELLMAVAPKLARVTALLNPADPLSQAYRARLQAAARRGPPMRMAEASTPHQIERTFQEPASDGPSGLIVTSDTLFYNERRTIAEMAARAGRPAVYPRRGYVEAGGLISWGPNPEANFARAAAFVDKIIRGAKPADLSLEPPAKLELVVNRNAMQNLGLSLPAELERQAVVIRTS